MRKGGRQFRAALIWLDGSRLPIRADLIKDLVARAADARQALDLNRPELGKIHGWHRREIETQANPAMRARQLGFEIELHYLWLSSPAQAIARVRQRVQQGGHHVPAGDIRRRFKRSLVHLLDDYLPLATRWAVWDSRSLPAKRLAISGENDIESLRKLIGV